MFPKLRLLVAEHYMHMHRRGHEQVGLAHDTRAELASGIEVQTQCSVDSYGDNCGTASAMHGACAHAVGQAPHACTTQHPHANFNPSGKQLHLFLL